jgi:hypothetical protein
VTVARLKQNLATVVPGFLRAFIGQRLSCVPQHAAEPFNRFRLLISDDRLILGHGSDAALLKVALGNLRGAFHTDHRFVHFCFYSRFSVVGGTAFHLSASDSAVA